MAGKTVTENQVGEPIGFGAAFDDATAHRMEESASSKYTGQSRRFALVAMSRNAEALAQLSIDEPEGYGEMRDAVEHFKRHAKALLEVATAANLRMQIADCRENTPAL